MDKRLLVFTLISVATLLGASNFMANNSAQDQLTAWQDWKLKNGKSYNTDSEEAYRFAVFCENDSKINSSNQAGNTHTEGHNMFSDLTAEEFRKIYLSGFKQTAEQVKPISYERFTYSGSVDFRQQGAVTPIKNQGQCGSCWAFGTVGGIEGRYKLNTGTLKSFSEQQITSCDTQDNGCGGGNPDTSYEYVNQNGLELESSYPYTSGGGDSGYCQYDRSEVVIASGAISGQQAPVSKSGYLSALDTQPLTVCLAAGAFQSYSGGVLSNSCDQQVDHCTTGVAYDDNAGYATIKNSWGPSWGENGYVRISISENAPYNGYCALYSNAYTATYQG